MTDPLPARRSVVLLPTYNECENITEILSAILLAAPVDVMVLDDNSPDGTSELAKRFARDNPRVLVIDRPEKLGLGAAYLDGFQRALDLRYERIIEMDADFSHPPDRLPALLEESERSDLVLGSRWVSGGGTRNWPLRRQIISRCGSFYARSLLGVGIRDLTGGFKCFRREVLAALDLRAIHSTGYAFQIEVTYRVLRLGYSVREIPIVFVERAEGRSKMSGHIVLEAVRRVPQLRWELRGL